MTWPVLVWQVHCAGLASSLELFSGHFWKNVTSSWKNVTSSCYEITFFTFFFRISGYVLGALDVRTDRVSLVRIQSTSWCMLKGSPEANHILMGNSSINGPFSIAMWVYCRYLSCKFPAMLNSGKNCWNALHLPKRVEATAKTGAFKGPSLAFAGAKTTARLGTNPGSVWKDTWLWEVQSSPAKLGVFSQRSSPTCRFRWFWVANTRTKSRGMVASCFTSEIWFVLQVFNRTLCRAKQ